MTQQDRLTYCKFCKNQLFDSSQGLLCRLTKSKASFNITCQDFSRDNEELDKARKGSGSYRVVGDKNTDYIFPYLLEADRQKYKVEKLKVHKKVFRSWEFYLWFILSISISSMILVKFIDSTILILIIVAVIFGVGVIYLNRLFKNKGILTIDKNGILLDDKFIAKWDNVIRFYFKSFTDINYNAPGLSRTIKTLVVEKFGNAEDTLIDLTPYGLNLSKLGKRIQIITMHNTQYKKLG